MEQSILAINHLHLKLIIEILFGIIVLQEFRNGYFAAFPSFFRSFPWRSYRNACFWVLVLIPLLYLDPMLLGTIQSFDSPSAEKVLNFGRMMGRNLWWYLMGLYLTAYLSGKRKIREIFLGALLGAGLAGAIGFLFKFIFLRARPFNNLGHFSFFNIEGLTEDLNKFQSFPSGDVVIVAGTVSYLFFKSRKGYGRWLLFLLPFSTALSRVMLNRHWPSDTVAAVLIALFVGHFFSRYDAFKNTGEVIR